ncbi:MAG: glycosyltransferase family 2 protein [Lachnospiraceae bacterium]|nr:glycosyltransferase family 2 protein [Lachnospiraceae bacterium]MBQ5484447.1 glycosyltransferase family 2 protein [Lachnospiraceae bacterium]
MYVEREELDLSVIFPCLNEAECVGQCVRDAKAFMEEENIRGEVLVVDNGSRDDSARQARSCGARVLYEKDTGYGNAIRCGLSKSRGQVVIFADCDMTYDVHRLWRLYEPLKRGEADIVIGDRFRGGIESGAMSLSHRVGVPILSFLGRMRYHVSVRDFHCGIRGLTREALLAMELHAAGMEFATEFIAEAARKNLRIHQVPVTLARPPEGRTSKLRTVYDGIRHLNYIMKCP